MGTQTGTEMEMGTGNNSPKVEGPEYPNGNVSRTGNDNC